MKIRNILLILLAVFSIQLIGGQTAYAAPDFSGAYVKGSPNTHYYYEELNGKTIIFNNYDSSAELFEGERQPYNFYELAYWSPEVDGFDLSIESSNSKVADVVFYDEYELYGDSATNDGYYTAIIEARKKGSTTITVTETTEEEPYIDYDEYGNEVTEYVEPTVRTYKFKVVVTDKWYTGRLHFNTKINPSKVYRNSKKMKVTIKNVYKGDKVTIKVGKNKTITKKIKKNKKSITYSIKFKKQTAGRKVVIKVFDKNGKKVKSSSKPVYYASKIKRGLTKKQVKLIPGWGSPQNIEINGKYTIWWYNDYSKYVYFKNGKVTGWGK